MPIVDLAVRDYLVAHCAAPDEVVTDLDAETRRTAPALQSSYYEGEALTMLVRLSGGRTAVSLGAFTGYTTLCLARGMGPEARIVACEVNPEWAATAKQFFERAGVSGQIDLRVETALDTVRSLPEDEHLDLGYIGADKVNYAVYYEELLRRLRPGGLLVLGDTLRGGYVVDPGCHEEDVEAVRRLNEKVQADDRVHAVLFPIGDGATIVQKKQRDG